MKIRRVYEFREATPSFAIDIVNDDLQCSTFYTDPFNRDIVGWHLELAGLKDRAVSAESAAVAYRRQQK